MVPGTLVLVSTEPAEGLADASALATGTTSADVVTTGTGEASTTGAAEGADESMVSIAVALTVCIRMKASATLVKTTRTTPTSTPTRFGLSLFSVNERDIDGSVTLEHGCTHGPNVGQRKVRRYQVPQVAHRSVEKQLRGPGPCQHWLLLAMADRNRPLKHGGVAFLCAGMANAIVADMMYRLLATISISSAILISSTFARADESSSARARVNNEVPPDEPSRYERSPSLTMGTWDVAAPKPRVSWYGLQTLIGSALFDTVSVLGLAKESVPLMAVGLAGRTLVAPTVHWIHGYGKRGFASLGLNVGLLLVGTTAGGFLGNYIELATAPPELDELGAGIVIGGLAGGLFGGITATVLDTALLSTEPLTDARARNGHPLVPAAIAFVPVMEKQRWGISIVGRF